MFTGLSAFPLTPLRDDTVDERAFAGLVERLADAGVDSITALGSTGSYLYLDRDERRRVATTAVEHAGVVPVLVGIGALRTSQVLALAEDAQRTGAAGLLLAPVTYQPLTDDDVYGLFEDVSAAVSVPVVLYDNPGTTHVTFTDDLYAAVARLPHVASIKIPGVPADAAARVQAIRDRVPADVTIGVSGDAFAARGLNAGCDAWYSVIGGTLPAQALALTRAAQAGDHAEAERRSEALAPLWDLFTEFGGSYRVVAALAEHLGLVGPDSLPRPVHGLDGAARSRVAAVADALELGTGGRGVG
ncbi:dihydrodipicolinate synthase family protein [Curtobacterium sp. MCBA15_001]|uniref:dihydrodipicolinate synthase family protein n=1 Tax=Curtobacterium sp. MCBA15_001 TaxID=1898731 RepID=UPI0008DE39AF|nr:dihydrodipicolinate synthase family protein [Curtobacterium sp. MCBA15_001]OIH92625.1 dihydrodipicolinate synthase family protein [Curtobacterium sp. MCBA15_001]